VGLKRASDFNTIQNFRFFEGPIDTWPWEGVKWDVFDLPDGMHLVRGKIGQNTTSLEALIRKDN
jgi:hypothetical protein